ncbi:MAG: Lrp/AsnC family transcriptional regulator [Planctomycetes bacterium]|jgi:Lrp/AsnC family leucine-responsive transcriptional regulator|nr:Lrp/AsnC family transcriptional regulator [Planctomycetota bacterium]
MDAIDLKILDILQVDGRTSHSEIAKAVGLSAPSVGERIKKLESKGVIKRYVAILDCEQVSRHITAFIAVSLDKPIHAKTFIQRIKELEDVLECYHVTGEMDYLLKVRTRSTSTLEALISNDLRPLDGVVSTRTSVTLSPTKEETRLYLKLEDLKS